MPKNTSGLKVFLTSLIIILLIVLLEAIPLIFVFSYFGSSNVFQQLVQIIAPPVIAATIISGLAAFSFRNFQKIKISYVIAGYIIQWAIILAFSLAAPLHFTASLPPMNLDIVVTPMRFFMKHQNAMLEATIAVIIVLKWLFDKNFKTNFIIDKQKANPIYYVQFFFLFIFIIAMFSVGQQMLSKMEFTNTPYQPSQGTIILEIIKSSTRVPIIFLGLVVVFILHYRHQLSFKNFAYLTALVNCCSIIPLYIFIFYTNRNLAIDSHLIIYAIIYISILLVSSIAVTISTQLLYFWIACNISSRFKPQASYLS
ncbi:hypothetical protein [Bartonella sp. HY406]|uniref:hypothetical protein n=1 Tax=Bartonella sp. HY406 TaxID=2979331 RepID=UPI0021CA4244|nr:hypothetical protein [Bartonella sp. HY406]UXN03287.1 hypothetical protein N6B01_12705 [Bartonella sp. HY406]